MGSTFKRLGKYYEILYADKDYEKECKFLEKIFKNYSNSTPRSILDVGCGTGGHAIPLAKRGYELTAVDLSDDMLNVARQKAKRHGVDIDFGLTDLKDLKLNKKFDVCICMFAVLDYITENEALQEVLFKIREHLKYDSLFVFDFWYGPAVLTIMPSSRIKLMERNGLRVLRFAEPRLDTLHHTFEVNYLLIVSRANQIVDEIREKHVVRYFFPEEIRYFLDKTGFKLLKLCPFMDLQGQLTEKVWNAVAISKAI